MFLEAHNGSRSKHLPGDNWIGTSEDYSTREIELGSAMLEIPRLASRSDTRDMRSFEPYNAATDQS